MAEDAPSESAASVFECNAPPCTDPRSVVEPKIRVRGRIEADAISASQSSRNKAIFGDLENAVGFRRARLGAEGSIGEQVSWISEFDFAGDRIAFKDVFVAIEHLPIVRRIRVGHIREPFSLEGNTSSNYFQFLERSPANAITPARKWGILANWMPEDGRVNLAAGLFKSGSNDAGDDIGDQNDLAFTARLTSLPWYDSEEPGRRLIHLGAAYSYRLPKDNIVTFSQGPQSSLLQFGDNPLVPFVSNVEIPAHEDQLLNAQAAVVLGPLSFQAEWDGSAVDQIGGPAVFLWGAYASASYFLTGENREYLPLEGAFGRVEVHRPFVCMKGARALGSQPGAWELVARIAYLDLGGGNIISANGQREGDRLSTVTLGVNWYLNDFMRVMFNAMHAIPVDPNFGPSYLDIFSVRTAIFW